MIDKLRKRDEPLREQDIFRYRPKVSCTNGTSYVFYAMETIIISGQIQVRYMNYELPGLVFDIVLDGTVKRNHVHAKAKKTLLAYLGNSRIVRPVTVYPFAYSYSISVYLDFIRDPSPNLICHNFFFQKHKEGGFRMAIKGEL